MLEPDDRIELEPPDSLADPELEKPKLSPVELLEPHDVLPLLPEDESILDPLESLDPGLVRVPIGITNGLGYEGKGNLGNGGFPFEFKNEIEKKRSCGLDVVFVIDSTSSMVPFIDGTKKVIDNLISRLGAVVPNIRLGIVSYRDRGDLYVTRHLNLTDDRYEILNFLDDTKAEEGGDLPEAVFEALKRTRYGLIWRKWAYKIVILVGDAPYHQDTEDDIAALVKEFSESSNLGQVNTVYVGRVSSPLEDDQKEAIRCMEYIARISGGEFTRYG